MHYLYQIVTSSFVYTLYEEDYRFILHILNLKNEESTDVLKIDKILDTLSKDTEISHDDLLEVEDVITTVLLCE